VSEHFCADSRGSRTIKTSRSTVEFGARAVVRGPVGRKQARGARRTPRPRRARAQFA
jgi:hypothetical protein